MAKSNCPAEDSAPPQASAGQLTPRFLPLSLSGRLLQVTVAISPSAAKGASKGWFSARIRSEGPRRQMQDFERRMKGELQRRNRNFFQMEGDADFRERVSRSIWPSKLGLSCYRILPAKWILSFIEEVSLALCVSVGWGRVFFGRESSLLGAFVNAAFVGRPSGLRKPENSEAPFRNFLSARGYGWLRRLRNEAWKK